MVFSNYSFSESQEQQNGQESNFHPGIHSYQLHLNVKHQIAEVLEEVRAEVKKNPEAYVQVRNRTWASINKRYLYERDYDKSVRCLEDAKKLLEKYRNLSRSG